MSTPSLFVFDAPATKPAARAPSPARRCAPQLPGVGVQYGPPYRDAGGWWRDYAGGAQASPWGPAPGPHRVPVLSPLDWVRWGEARAHALALSESVRGLPFEPSPAQLEEQLARDAEKQAQRESEARAEAWRASQMGTISARITAHEPEGKLLELTPSMPSKLAGAEQVPLWTEGACAPDLLWLDTETTGRVAGEHQVIEVACLRTARDGSNVRPGWSSLVLLEPHAMVDASALEISGLNPRSTSFKEQARPLVDVLEQLTPHLEGVTLAGHNVDFDRRFLAAHYEQCDRPVPVALQKGARVVDTLPLARALKKAGRLVTESCSLGALVEVLKIPPSKAHRAAGDVGMTLRVYRALKKLEAGCA